MPNGKEVWIQLLDRQQKHLLLVVFSIHSFVPLNNTENRSVFPLSYVLWEESSCNWISVSILKFLNDAAL